jgi:transcription elongation GreA/GreB family factor
MSWNDRLQELITALEQERDELRLKVHLASRDARDEFEALEARLDELRARLGDATSEARGTATDVGGVVGETARKLADDLRDGYRRIRDQLAD